MNGVGADVCKDLGFRLVFLRTLVKANMVDCRVADNTLGSYFQSLSGGQETDGGLNGKMDTGLSRGPLLGNISRQTVKGQDLGTRQAQWPSQLDNFTVLLGKDAWHPHL